MNRSTPRSSKPTRAGSIPARRAENTDPGWAPRFRAKIDTNGPLVQPELGPCWVWTARRDPAGYGRFQLNRRPELAHRVAWLLTHGAVPALLRHRCGTNACVREDHLLEGTQAENCQDSVEQGKTTFGERHPLHRLTEEQATEIRRRRLAGEAAISIAKDFPVHPSRIYQIGKGTGWPHLARSVTP